MNNQPEPKQNKQPVFDEVLKRMLDAPPKPKTSEKPADKSEKAKPAK